MYLSLCMCVCHAVRSHGQVPPITWEDHTITITGLVDKPVVLNMVSRRHAASCVPFLDARSIRIMMLAIWQPLQA